MISIETLSIRHFRGIKELDLQLSGKNFGIYGPNGTGKSGVVDAIEFCLTGDVTRLSGAGTEDLSVVKHAPHVDWREKADKAVVTITGHLPGIEQLVTIQRTVKAAKKVTITPDEQVVKDAIEEIQRHPELALSRREIVKYVITPAGRRDTDVKTLLRLDKLDKIRKSLTTVANQTRSRAESAATALETARRELLAGLGLDVLTAEGILDAVNNRREILNLPALTKLATEVSLKDGLAGDGTAARVPMLVKATATKEVAELIEAASGEEPAEKETRETARDALAKLSEDMATFHAIRQSELVKAGLALVDADACPLCDKPWDQEDLRAHLQSKIESAEEAQKAIDGLSLTLAPIRDALRARASQFNQARDYAKTLKKPEAEAALNSEAVRLLEIERTLDAAFDDGPALKAAISRLEASWTTPPECCTGQLQILKTEIEALPDKSKEDEAKEFLILADDRYAVSTRRKREADIAETHAKIAEQARDLFNECSETTLTEIYDTVAEEFADSYKVLNKGDEDSFSGTLTAAPARLSLDVDFYGRGKFPPGAFHSEGHQDAMGLCLYLALMKQTMGDQFRLCVLDDVLMSVDAGHRRQVCRLLTTEFPNTQFVLTTHDRVWLQFMKSENLIERAQTFGGWSVDTGPLIFDHKDTWAEIEEALKSSDVPIASGRLRRYLEYVGNLLCDGVRAPVPFHGDGRYALNELLPPGLKRVKSLMKDAKKAAESWGKDASADQISADIATFSAAVSASQAENWAINPSVHYTEWENFEPDEFRSVVDAFNTVVTQVRCPVCDTFLHLSLHGMTPEAMRCQCGAKQYDLTAKKGH